MRRTVHHLSVVFVFAIACTAARCQELPELMERSWANVTVVYARPSEALVDEIIRVCVDTRTFLAPLYGLPEDHPVTVNWVSEARYAEFTKVEYGFPSHSSKGEILPAADIDLPTSLTHIADILDIEKERPEDLARFKALTGLAADASKDDILEYLRTSKEFYVRYCMKFILPHEIVHAFNVAAGTPTRPKWLHEWQAQYGALLVCRATGRNDDAELFTLYYRMMYRGGKDMLTYRTIAECNEQGAKMGVRNYAWFHGALIEMFCQLEAEHGPDFGRKVLQELNTSAAGKKDLSDADIISIVGRAVGADMRRWFAETWGIR